MSETLICGCKGKCIGHSESTLPKPEAAQETCENCGVHQQYWDASPFCPYGSHHRLSTPSPIEPSDLVRFDVLAAFRAFVTKTHFFYVGFTHKKRLAA